MESIILEAVRDFSIVVGPFVVGGALGVAIENHKERKTMKKRHDKRFKEIKEANRRRGIK